MENKKEWHDTLYAVKTNYHCGIYTKWENVESIQRFAGFKCKKFKTYDNCIKFLKNNFDEETLQKFEERGKGIQFDRLIKLTFEY